jgi:hypothetical protein
MPLSTQRVRGEEANAVREHLAGLICEKLLTATEPAKATEVAEDLPPVGTVSPRLVRETLRTDGRFIAVERRWDLAAREELATRPIGGAITALLEAYGKPVSAETVADQIATSRRRLPESLEDTILELLTTRQQYVLLDSGLYALREWLLTVEDKDEADVLFYNDLSGSEEFAAAEGAIGRKQIKGNTPADTAERIVDIVGGTIANKVLAFLVWRQHPSSNPAVLFDRMMRDERFVLMSGPRWCAASFQASLNEMVEQLSARTEVEAHEGDETADLQALLAAPPPEGTVFTVSDIDVDEAVAAIASQGSASLDTLVTATFEVYPGDESFSAAIHALGARLMDRSDIMSVGPGVYAATNAIPAGMGEVPPALRPVFVEKPGDDDLPMDVILTDTGIGSDLAGCVQAPENEEICEEDEVRTKRGYEPPEEVRHVLPYHHLQAGTLKVRQIDRSVFPEEPRLVRMTLVYAEGEEHVVWIDNEVGLLHGLEEWYSQYVPGPGAIIGLAPTSDSLRLQLVYDGEADKAAYIDETRLGELLALRDTAQRDGLSVYEIISDLLRHHEDGASFETLLSEVNVVRRTTKRLVASVLGSYHCFRGGEGAEPNQWRFDERAVEMGRIKAKKRYISAAQPPAEEESE